VIGLGGVGRFCMRFFARVESSDCLMGLVGKLPDETGYISVYFYGENVF
jgi:hypothetical protein